MLLGIVVLLLLALVIMAITSGVVYSHWLDLIGKGATLGKNKFNIYVSTKRCVVIFMGNGDFVAVYHHFIGFLFSAFAQLLTGCMFGLCSEGSALFMALRHLGAILGDIYSSLSVSCYPWHTFVWLYVITR